MQSKNSVIILLLFLFSDIESWGLPCYNLDRRTAAISHVFLYATTKGEENVQEQKVRRPYH